MSQRMNKTLKKYHKDVKVSLLSVNFLRVYTYNYDQSSLLLTELHSRDCKVNETFVSRSPMSRKYSFCLVSILDILFYVRRY